MSDDNKIKLGEQLIRCVLDDKLSMDKKLRKMDEDCHVANAPRNDEGGSGLPRPNGLAMTGERCGLLRR